MNWATKAREFVNDTRSMFFRPKHLSRFEYGARWQREQLRTPEAIERVALELISQRGYYTGEGWPTNQDLSGGPTGDRDVEFKSAWMANAEEAIDALLGDD